MLGLTVPVLDFLVQLFTGYGYLAVFSMLVICGFGVPIPEDLVLIAGGVIAGFGDENVHVMYAVGVLGVLAGDGTMFLIGRHLGPQAMRRPWVSRFLTKRRYRRVQRQFARHGNSLMFVARFLPGLRAPIYLTAGMTREVRLHHFLLLDGAAALISVPVWVYLGFYGALNHDWLLMWIRRSKIAVAACVIIILLAVALLIWWRRHRRNMRLQQLQQQRQNRRSCCE